MGATRFDTARKLIKTAGNFFTINKNYVEDTKELQYEFSREASRFLYLNTGNYGTIRNKNYGKESAEPSTLVDRPKVIFYGNKSLSAARYTVETDAGLLLKRTEPVLRYTYSGESVPVFTYLEIALWIQKGKLLVMHDLDVYSLSYSEVPRWIANNINQAIIALYLPQKYGYTSFITEDETNIYMQTTPLGRNPMTIPKFGGRMVVI